jgi:serine/threonine-protein kinase
MEMGCPAAAILRAYSLGELPLATLESVASHVSLCPRCETLLDHLGDTSDGLVVNLRRHVAPDIAGLHEGRGAPSALLPRRFCEYRLDELLEEGEVWSVFVARQDSPDRVVAVKMASGGPPAGAEALDHFRTEIGAAARLAHPNIVPVYEYDVCEGRPYFSMEFMGGGTLPDKLRGGSLPEREAAGAVRTLALAIQYAHDSGIVHRDLKPAKVFLGAGGAMKLTGFWGGRLLDANGRWTLTGAARGTGLSMAPEQAWGDGRTVGPAADIWALGAILYECLTGRAPFPLGNFLKTLERVRTGEADPPSAHRRGLSRELEAICRKCLQKDPLRRYRTARALADALGRWLRGEPAEADEVNFVVRLFRAARRLFLL